MDKGIGGDDRTIRKLQNHGTDDRSVIFSFQPGPAGESAVYASVSSAVSTFTDWDTGGDPSLPVAVDAPKPLTVCTDNFGIAGRFFSH